MPTRDVVVVGASAGGIEALRDVLSGVAPDFSGVVLIVLHMPPGGASTLPAILGRVSPIPVAEAVDGEPLEGGRVYVCRSDHHLLLGDGHIRVSRGPMEHGHRPAADPLFRSAARRYGPRAVGVVLSGTLSDGSEGLRSIRGEGGIAVVQDPADALYPGMPQSALDAVGADHVVPAAEIGPLVSRLSHEAVSPHPPPALDDLLRFGSRGGDTPGREALPQQPGAEVEEALWMALRSLEDRATLSRTLADRAEATGRVMSARQFRGDADDMSKSIGVLRRLLQGVGEPGAERGRNMADAGARAEPGPGVELVLEHLKEVRAFDFTGYKRATLARRIEKRMEQVGVTDHEAYVDHLAVHPDELEPLFNTILINVTSFFRDPDAWSALAEGVIPELLARKPDGPIRIWSAGCSSGQEAFSALMLFAEVLGIAGAREWVKVYATDVDEEALEQARQATFTERDMEGVPAELAERYFARTSAGRVLNPDLRRAVIFGRHDLLQDAPISRVDLLLCRNTLMYFNADVQALLVHRLHYSVADDGYLLLGKVETLPGQDELFEAIDSKRRLFRKLSPASLRGQLLAMAGGSARTAPGHPERLVDAAFEHGADAQMVLDADGLLLAVNRRARAMFAIPPEVLGRPFQDLEISYRPVELRSSIDEARDEQRAIRLAEVPRWTPAGVLSFLDISVAPLIVEGEHAGVALSFVDVTTRRQLQEELEQTHRELEVAYEELQSANEELETTNEELQSTIEELETTNEELQSTNEELETMNEELSSTNEELHAINDELRDRTSEVDQVNAYLESVLTGFDASVVVVDPELRVRIWHGRSFEMWGLRSEEAEGQALLSLDIGFPVAQLRPALFATLAGDPPGEPLLVDATNRRGRAVRCAARVNRLSGADGKLRGAIVIIEEIAEG